MGRTIKSSESMFADKRLLSTYFKQSTALKNKLNGEEALGNPCKLKIRSLKRSLRHIERLRC